MKKQLTLIICSFLLALLMINSASAIVQYAQRKSFPTNTTHITRTHASLFWSKAEIFATDNIRDGDLYEVYVQYSMYPKTWKEENYDYRVENCTLTINLFETLLNYSYPVYEETLTSEDNDIYNKKYFARLNKGDGFTADMDCYFFNDSLKIYDTPTELLIVTPSWECKECQFYEWSVQQRNIAKAELLGANTVTVWGYIKELGTLNYEIFLAVFWLILILIAIGGMGFVFLGIYWCFLFLRKIAKGI